MVSAGNTGAAMIAAKMVVGAIPGVDRPALAAVFPNRTGRTVVLDVGANIDSKAEHLRQFAVMGHFYAQEVLHTPSPRNRNTPAGRCLHAAHGPFSSRLWSWSCISAM